MIETMTLGGETILMSHREPRRLAESQRRESARLARLRAEWHAARGESVDTDPFAVFD